MSLHRILALSAFAAGCGTYGLTGDLPPSVDTGGLTTGEGPDSDPDDTEGNDAPGGGGSAPDDNPDDEETGGDGGSEGSGAGSEAEPTEPACTREGFDILIHQATQDDSVPGQPLFLYQARDTDTVPFGELQVISYQAAPYYGPSTAGRYPLSGLNYADCGLCMLLVTGCSDGYSCDEVFFIEDGTLDVADFGQTSGRFQATIRDAVFAEVEIDPSTYESRPIPGGERWCVQDIGIDVATYWIR